MVSFNFPAPSPYWVHIGEDPAKGKTSIFTDCLNQQY